MLTKMITGTANNIKTTSQQTLTEKLAQAKAYYLSLVQPARLFFKGQADLPIHYTVDICEQEQAALVIVPGWAETGMRYAELMLDLKKYNLSYYLLDHRGMGFSGRTLSDTQKTHVEKFQYYVDDLKKFIDTIVNARPHKKTYIVAHSLGGLITTSYLEQEQKQFDGAILSSPLLDISNKLMSESLIQRITQAGEFLGKGADYALGQKGAAPENRFKEANTHSFERWQFFENIQQQHPEIKKGGMTNHWLTETIQAVHKVRAGAGRLKTPTLLFQAEKDTMAPAHGQNLFCTNGNIEKILFPNARHEILMEADTMRDQALERIVQFFDLH